MGKSNKIMIGKWGAIIRIVHWRNADLVNPIKFRFLKPAEHYPDFYGTVGQLKQEARDLFRHLKEQMPSKKSLKLEFISHINREDGAKYMKARISIFQAV